MATFFGEVILPSSRAFFDDFDEEESEETDNCPKSKPKLILKKHQDVSPTNYESLVICDGAVAKGFGQMHILPQNSKLLAEIQVEKQDDSDSAEILVLNPKKVESTKLFSLPNNNLLLLISSNIDLGMCNNLTLLLRPWLNNCKRVISVVSQHIANYRCDSINELPPAFVRGLSTSHQTFPLTLKRLEQPNFVSNTSASVLTWCEGQKLAGLLLVLYSDQEVVEDLTISPLLKAFSDTGLSHLLLNQPAPLVLSDTLKNLDRSFMYM